MSAHKLSEPSAVRQVDFTISPEIRDYIARERISINLEDCDSLFDYIFDLKTCFDLIKLIVRELYKLLRTGSAKLLRDINARELTEFQFNLYYRDDEQLCERAAIINDSIHEIDFYLRQFNDIQNKIVKLYPHIETNFKDRLYRHTKIFEPITINNKYEELSQHIQDSIEYFNLASIYKLRHDINDVLFRASTHRSSIDTMNEDRRRASDETTPRSQKNTSMKWALNYTCESIIYELIEQFLQSINEYNHFIQEYHAIRPDAYKFVNRFNIHELYSPFAKIPDASVPDASVPGTRVPGARVPGARVPGARVPGARVPDSSLGTIANPILISSSDSSPEEQEQLNLTDMTGGSKYKNKPKQKYRYVKILK